MTTTQPDTVSADLKRLTDAFFRAVSFEPGARPSYEDLYALFIDSGLLIKNVGPTPEISTVAQFIRPRQASVDSGQLTQFHEAEISHVTEVFGNIAHRFSSYVKSGTLDGTAFHARGMISTQFVRTADGWKMSAMAWDDERAGLVMPERFALSDRQHLVRGGAADA
ncbi:MAG: hypothetical protein OEU89_04230 [Burkholderiaceae bacterium]|nr:hypothetical protein [Burkholderiaceae bacterium]MDH5285488.1 hypothetical protein [Betaproteobacteria bacterium]